MKHKFIALTLLLVVYCIGRAVMTDEIWEYIVSAIILLLIVASLYDIGHRKRFVLICSLLFGVSLAILTFSGGVAELSYPLLIAQTILSIVFFSLIGFTTLKYTLYDSEVSINNIWGAISTYLLIGLAWSYIYQLIAQLNNAAFNINLALDEPPQQSMTLMYYSFTTLTTLGYGDIVALSDIARTLSWMEAVMGQLFLTVLIAQLVGQYIAKKKSS